MEGQLVIARGIRHSRLEIRERQIGEVAQQEGAINGLVLVALVLDIGSRGALKSIDIECAHLVRLLLARIAGAITEMAAPACWQHVVGRELASLVGRGIKGRTHTVEEGIYFNARAFGRCAAASQRQLTAQVNGLFGIVAVGSR